MPQTDPAPRLTVPLDALDRAILELLQTDARLPIRLLAERVGSSPATCQRRIARLRAGGALQKRVVLVVDPGLVGRPPTVIVAVELAQQHAALLAAFERRMAAEPAVSACCEVSGEFDFLLIVSAASRERYHAFTREGFSSTHNVRNFKSTVAMDCSKLERRIPLPGD